MPAPYSQDLRDRVLASCHRGMKTKQIADLFSVSSSWVRRVKQRLREHGEVAPCALEPKCRFMKIDRFQLAKLVEAHPDATLGELHMMQSMLDTITPTDAINCFKHCGYSLHGD